MGAHFRPAALFFFSILPAWSSTISMCRLDLFVGNFPPKQTRLRDRFARISHSKRKFQIRE